MKSVKLFESWLNDYHDQIINSMKKYKVGDITSHEAIYNFVEALHDGDLDNEFIIEYINNYSRFQLVELPISELDLDSIGQSLVDEYIEIYKRSNWYPPILYDKENDLIIDGYHRANALEQIGVEKILSWVGIPK